MSSFTALSTWNEDEGVYVDDIRNTQQLPPEEQGGKDDEAFPQIVKIHLLQHVEACIKFGGALHNLNTEAGEHYHSLSVKRSYMSRKSPSLSAKQTVLRERDRVLFHQLASNEQTSLPSASRTVKTFPYQRKVGNLTYAVFAKRLASVDLLR